MQLDFDFVFWNFSELVFTVFILVGFLTFMLMSYANRYKFIVLFSELDTNYFFLNRIFNTVLNRNGNNWSPCLVPGV